MRLQRQELRFCAISLLIVNTRSNQNECAVIRSVVEGVLKDKKHPLPKVVILTFSGNWCSPCRSKYPDERKLVERLRDKKFALVSVNTDESVATLRESIRKGEITWRCWWDGKPGGPISSRWNFLTWPTTYVLDAQGIIRAKNPRAGSLDQLIGHLLEEEPSAPSAARPK